MADVLRFKVPVEAGVELSSIIHLDDKHTKRQPLDDLIDKPDRRSLIAGTVDFKHPNTRAVVDGGELIQPPCGARDSLEELNIQLQTMDWLRLLIPLT